MDLVGGSAVGGRVAQPRLSTCCFLTYVFYLMYQRHFGNTTPVFTENTKPVEIRTRNKLELPYLRIPLDLFRWFTSPVHHKRSNLDDAMICVLTHRLAGAKQYPETPFTLSSRSWTSRVCMYSAESAIYVELSYLSYFPVLLPDPARPFLRTHMLFLSTRSGDFGCRYSSVIAQCV